MLTIYTIDNHIEYLKNTIIIITIPDVLSKLTHIYISQLFKNNNKNIFGFIFIILTINKLNLNLQPL